MSDWLRSFGVLAAAFVGVAVVTMGLAGVLAPGPVGSAADPGASGIPASGPVAVESGASGGIPGLGGTLTVSGDREGELRLTHQSIGERYSLDGSDGRVGFEGQPARPAQISYDGLEFFPDETNCTITPGNLDGAVGIGFGQLECTDLVDVRGGGTISLSGTIGLPIDMLAARTLPPSGGSLSVGDETWMFEDAFLATWDQPSISGTTEYNLELADVPRGAVIGFHYDIESHVLSLVDVTVGETSSMIAADACDVDREELGVQNPRTKVIELTVDCPAVEVPGMGAVPLSGTVVVDELAWPE